MTAPISLGGFTITWEEITPAIAEAYLGKNLSNRHIRNGHVTALASDMTAGRWQPTHMALGFDTDGNLIDGQHRLLAIIQSGVSQWMLVVREVAKSVQEVIDAGAARSGADALKLSGRVDSNHPAVAAVARTAILWDEGHHRTVRAGVNGARKVTNSEITAWVDDQLALPVGALNVTGAVGQARTWHGVNDLMPLSISSFCMLLLGSVDEADAVEFFNNLDSTSFTSNDDPIFQLYRRLNIAKMKKEGLRISQVLWYIITAWNAFRDGQAGGTGELDAAFVKPSGGGGWTATVQPRVKKKGNLTIYPLVPDPD
jgi:hypothetical protein